MCTIDASYKNSDISEGYERDPIVSSYEEDEHGLEKEKGHEAEIEVPFDPKKIDILAKPMTINSLESRLENNELNLTPDFQRQANLWDTHRKSRLIESILLRIPLPSFYFSEDTDGGYAVVDGLQRLCAIFHFKNSNLLQSTTGVSLNLLRLEGLQYLKDLENKTYTELDRNFQRRISELEITANIIRSSTPVPVKFNVFARLNQGGMPLNAQEIRNAIFPGKWRDELRNLAESEEFRTATDKKIKTQRQQDMELVLRFLALWQLGEPHVRPPNQTLDEFLNLTVEKKISAWNPDMWKQATTAFYHAIDAANQIRGVHAFRKSSGTQKRNPINRGLFEAELIVFGSLNPSLRARAARKQKEIERLFSNALIHNKGFIVSLQSGTGSSESSNMRIKVLRQIIEEGIHA